MKIYLLNIFKNKSIHLSFPFTCDMHGIELTILGGGLHPLAQV